MNLMNRLNPAPWSVSNGSADRSPDKYLRCLKQFNFDSQDRYAPENGVTFCNIAASDAAPALGCHIPHVHLNYGSGYTVQEFRANDLYDWFPGEDGRAFGWQPVNADDAKKAAALGFPTVVLWYNPEGPGHIAWVLPDGTLGQAGGKCGYGFAFSQVFTQDMLPKLRYFTHS